MRFFGTIFPFVGLVIGPCNADGVPAMSPDETASVHFETKAVCIAWLGFAQLIAFGEIEPRMVDPINPRRYAAGNL